ncbi:hypothetical protein VTO42DRAFT_6380 [Malbranchea cinnamomea]
MTFESPAFPQGQEPHRPPEDPPPSTTTAAPPHHLRAASVASTRSEGYNPWAHPPAAEHVQGQHLSPLDTPAGLGGSQVPERPSSLGAFPAAAAAAAPAAAGAGGGAGGQDAFWEGPWQHHNPRVEQNMVPEPAFPIMSSSPSASVAQFQSNNPFRRAIEQRASFQSVSGSVPSTPPVGYRNERETAATPTPPPPFSVDERPAPPQTIADYSSSHDAPGPPNTAVVPLIPPKQTSTGEEPIGQPPGPGDSHGSVQVGNQSTMPSAPIQAASGDLIDFGEDEQVISHGVSQLNVAAHVDPQRPDEAQATAACPAQSPEYSQPQAPADKSPPPTRADDASAAPSAPQISIETPPSGPDEQPSTTSQPRPEAEASVRPAEQPAEPPREPRRRAPMTEAQIRQREAILAETYDIRKVDWTDGVTGMRQSPVLVQNENGPCPLLALVNGLVMRTKPGTDSPLIRILQSKEKISVELLIHALFEELTVWVGEDDLPDIEDLGSFLTVLHTGMNVNPRLTAITAPENVPGTFLATRDTKLYSSFKLPLVHGWLAPPGSPAHAALTRAAEYHDDIQLLHFRKEELEDKVSRGIALSPDELQLIQDIEIIHDFLRVNATQLSEYGLEHLNRSLEPGSISILFRNEHFSTLFKHPLSHQLFTLVTDMGYAGHAEIVWESLVDVNGSQSELFSGDFRPVGHAPSSASPPTSERNRRHLSSSLSLAEQLSREESQTHTEESDRDYALALALQYQDEEEQHTRRESSGGRQNNVTGSSNNSNNNNRTSGRGSRFLAHHFGHAASGRDRQHRGAAHSQAHAQPQPQQQQQHVRSLIPQDNDPNHIDDPNVPPPTYEQAAKTPAYIPPEGHPQYSGPFTDNPQRQPQNGAGAGIAGPRTSSQNLGRGAAAAGAGGGAAGRRGRQGQQLHHHAQQQQHQQQQQYTSVSGGGRREKKDCIVM